MTQRAKPHGQTVGFLRCSPRRSGTPAEAVRCLDEHPEPTSASRLQQEQADGEPLDGARRLESLTSAGASITKATTNTARPATHRVPSSETLATGRLGPTTAGCATTPLAERTSCVLDRRVSGRRPPCTARRLPGGSGLETARRRHWRRPVDGPVDPPVSAPVVAPAGMDPQFSTNGMVTVRAGFQNRPGLRQSARPLPAADQQYRTGAPQRS